MGFDIVRGKITKPEQSNQLIEAVQEYMDKNAATGKELTIKELTELVATLTL